MRRTAAFAVAVAMLCAGARAQVTPPSDAGLGGADANTVLRGITAKELQQILTDAGYTAALGSIQNSLDAMTPGGYKFIAQLADCPEGDEPRCDSISMTSYDFNESTHVTLKSVNEWNRKSWGARGMIYQNGASGVVMNVSLTGGVTAAWVKQQLSNFDYWMTQYGKFVGGVKDAPAPTTP
jgi:hypothetical protein